MAKLIAQTRAISLGLLHLKGYWGPDPLRGSRSMGLSAVIQRNMQCFLRVQIPFRNVCLISAVVSYRVQCTVHGPNCI